MIKGILSSLSLGGATKRPVGRWMLGVGWERRADQATTDCVPGPLPPHCPAAPATPPDAPHHPPCAVPTPAPLGDGVRVLNDPACLLVFETQAPSRSVTATPGHDITARVP